MLSDSLLEAKVRLVSLVPSVVLIGLRPVEKETLKPPERRGVGNASWAMMKQSSLTCARAFLSPLRTNMLRAWPVASPKVLPFCSFAEVGEVNIDCDLPACSILMKEIRGHAVTCRNRGDTANIQLHISTLESASLCWLLVVVTLRPNFAGKIHTWYRTLPLTEFY